MVSDLSFEGDIGSVVEEVKKTFNLNSYEAKAYLSLLLGARSAKEVSIKGRIPRPRVYDVLKSLHEKGLIVKKKEFYEALEPEEAASIVSAKLRFEVENRIRELAAKSRRLSEVLEGLRSFRVDTSGRVELLEGFEQIIPHFVSELSKSSRAYFLIKKAVRFRELFLAYLSSISRVPKIKAIIQCGVEIRDEDLEFAKRINAELRRVEYLPYDMMVSDSGAVIVGFPDPFSTDEKKPIAFLVKSVKIAEAAFRELEEAWSRLKSECG